MRIKNNIGRFLLTVFILTFFVYLFSYFAPIDQSKAFYGNTASRISTKNNEFLKEEFSLKNENIIKGYINWSLNFLKLDMGYSLKHSTDVKTILFKALKNSFLLNFIAFLILVILTPIMTYLTFTNRLKFIGNLLNLISRLSFCIPEFWLIILLTYIFSFKFRFFSSSFDIFATDYISYIKSLAIPIIVIVISHIGYYCGYLQKEVEDELKENYVLYLRARGFSNSYIFFKHILKKSIPSYLSFFSNSFIHLVSGSYTIEYMFSYPGMGKILIESAKTGDYNLLLSCITITGIIVIIGFFICEFISNNADPLRKDGDNIGFHEN